jgi:uncharacterized protein
MFHVKQRIRRLVTGDEAALEAFLAAYPESSMFLRANLRRVGLVDNGEPYQGTYVASFAGPEMTGAIAHFWNGTLHVQAPASVETLAPATVDASCRAVSGLLGPAEQVARARRALGLEAAATTTDSRDDLFALSLAALIAPPCIAKTVIRAPRTEELDRMADWSASFHREALGFAGGAELERNCRDQVRRLQEERAQFVLAIAGEPVAYAAFNAVLPDVVQLGGVWTPPEFRGRGYGRRVVAGALLQARAAGADRAVLFTGPENNAAQSAYRSLGFARVGDYGLVIFA